MPTFATGFRQSRGRRVEVADAVEALVDADEALLAALGGAAAAGASALDVGGAGNRGAQLVVHLGAGS